MTAREDGVPEAARRFAAARYGPDCRITEPTALPGNSGQTLRFRVCGRDGKTLDVLVARTTPAGVRPSAHFDLERQAGFLSAAAQAALPVPEPLFAANAGPGSAGGTLITRWQAGASVPDWSPAAPGRIAAYEQAARILARIHRLPVDQTPAAADEPRSPRAEVDHWAAVAARAQAGDRWPQFDRLAQRLADAAPEGARSGVTHGDYRLGNLILRGERVAAVVDWELARQGPTALDLAWLLMYLDAPWWHAGAEGGAAPADALRVRDAYLAAGAEGRTGRCADPVADLAWFEAAARFKQVAIIGYNLRLHRSGKRPDAHWEQMERAVPVLTSSALRLLDQSPVR